MNQTSRMQARVDVEGCTHKWMNRWKLDSMLKPEDHWSCIAHLSAEDMLKSVVIEEKKFKHSPWAGADNPLRPKDVNRKASSLRSFVASLKRISSTSDFIDIFS